MSVRLLLTDAAWEHIATILARTALSGSQLLSALSGSTFCKPLALPEVADCEMGALRLLAQSSEHPR